MAEGRIEKCPHCGNLYRVYPFAVGDQSACPKRRREADKNSQRDIWTQSLYKIKRKII